MPPARMFRCMCGQNMLGKCDRCEPGTGWTISPETQKALDEIEANIREAHRLAPFTFFD